MFQVYRDYQVKENLMQYLSNGKADVTPSLQVSAELPSLCCKQSKAAGEEWKLPTWVQAELRQSGWGWITPLPSTALLPAPMAVPTPWAGASLPIRGRSAHSSPLLPQGMLLAKKYILKSGWNLREVLPGTSQNTKILDLNQLGRGFEISCLAFLIEHAHKRWC